MASIRKLKKGSTSYGYVIISYELWKGYGWDTAFYEDGSATFASVEDAYSYVKSDLNYSPDDGDNIVIDGVYDTYYFRYGDTSIVWDLNYQENPVYKLIKDGNVVFNPQFAEGQSTTMGYSAKTMTSITWRFLNPASTHLASFYAQAKTGGYYADTSFYTDGVFDGTLNSSYLRDDDIDPGSYGYWAQTGLTPLSTYYCKSIAHSFNNLALIDGTPSTYSTMVAQGITAAMTSVTTSSVSFRVYNYTSYTVATKAGTSYPGSTTVGSGLASGGSAIYTLSGLSANTSYTIYVDSYYLANNYYASFSAKTESSVVKPTITNVDVSYCEGPYLTIYNPNAYTVSVYGGTTSSPTSYKGTLGAKASANFLINAGSSAGTSFHVYTRFYNSSYGYSTSTLSTGTTNTICYPFPEN